MYSNPPWWREKIMVYYYCFVEENLLFLLCITKHGPTASLLQVFAVTSVFSLVAYIWLLLILVAISPNVVEVWEALVTLVLFPLLVFLAWLAEKNLCGMPSKTETKQMELGSFEPGESKLRSFQFERSHPVSRSKAFRLRPSRHQ